MSASSSVSPPVRSRIQALSPAALLRVWLPLALGLSSLASAQTYTLAGSNPIPTLQFGARMVFIDADSDGDLDLLSQNGNTTGTGIELRLSNANGTFGAPIAATAGTGAFTSGPFNGVSFPSINFNSSPSMFAVDINTDGRTDLVELNNAAAGRFIINNGNGTWTSQASPLPQLTFAQRAFFGDFDHDGDVDALLQNGNTPGTGISLYLNNGNGTFAAAINATAGTGAFTGGPFNGLSFTHITTLNTVSLYYFDYDHDGDKDIIEQVNAAAGRVLRNNGNGTWTSVASPLPTLAFSARMRFLDLDNDGDIDAFYQNGNGSGVGFEVGINNGSGSFVVTAANGTGTFGSGPLTGHTFTTFTSNLIFSLDIEYDGDLDILEQANGAPGRLFLQGGNPPDLASTVPADNATSVSPSTNISLTFDRSVVKGTGNILIRRTSDNVVVETIDVTSSQVTGAGATWVVNPNITLTNGTAYAINIGSGTFVDSSSLAYPGLSDNFGLNFVTSAPDIAVTRSSAAPPTQEILDGGSLPAFGSTLVGASATPVTLYIHNLGSSDLTGLAVTRTGTNAADYTVTQPLSTPLAPGSSTSFTVTFSPTAAAAGRVATLQIASNDADENPFDIGVTGTGANTTPQVALALSTTSLNGSDSTVVAGETATYSMAVTTVEGTTSGLGLVAQLPAGMAYIPGSATVDSTAFNGTVPAPTVSPASGVTYLDGTDVTVNFSAITATQDGNAANNVFTISFQAVVLEVVGNISGNSLTVSGTRASTGNSAVAVTGTPAVAFVEPAPTLAQAFTVTSGGENTPFNIVWTIANPVGAQTFAYDLGASATLPAGLSYTSGFSVFRNSTDVTASFAISAGVVSTTTPPDLAPGDTLVFTIPVQTNAGVAGGSSLSNTVTLNYSSYPGTRSAPTFNPNSDVTADVERLYSATDTDSFAVSNITLTSASIDENNAPSATVGTLGSAGVSGTPTFSLTSGTGSTDNASFSISGTVLRITPVANFEAKSSYSIRVRVDNGAGTAADKVFVIAINDVNEAPTISDIAALAINEDANTGTLSFSIGDVDSGNLAGLTVSGTSDNTALVPNANIVFGGSGASRTVTVTPAANGNGSATITVTVTDASLLSTTDTFVLTVNALNDAPSFVTGGPRTVLEDSGPFSGAWATSISSGPANENAQAVDFIVSNDNTALFSAQPAISPAGVLTFTPAANASGSATVSVRIHDDGGAGGGNVDTSAVQTFLISVTAVNDTPTLAAIPDPAVLGLNPGAQTVSLSGITTGAPNETQTLALTATSSNPTLIPTPTFTYTSPNATGSLSFTPANNQSGTAIITVRVTDNGGASNGAVNFFEQTFSVSVNPEADLAITVTDGVTTATPGGSMTYTITVSNAGPSAVTGATVVDTFPASLTATWTGVGAGGGTGPASGSGNINTSAVNLPSGGSFTFTVNATINASATGTLTNTATVSSSVTDPNNANNSATDTDTLTPNANLAITVTDGVTTAVPGGSVTYTITASNAGLSNVTGATVADTFPASLTNVTWVGVGAGGGTVTAAGSGNINDMVNLPAGGSVTYTVSATIAPGATGSLSNTATITSSVADSVPGNNSATDTDTLTPQADLSITKTDGVTTATAGGSVTYTITVSNAGPSTATGAIVADTFPASLTGTWTAAGANGATGTLAGSGNINQAVTLPPGSSFTYTVSASISAAATGTLSNTAAVTAPGGVTDGTPGNNSATDSDTISQSADLAITVTDGVTTAIPGGTVTYTITASNAGPSNVTGATVADTFPATLTNVTWTGAGAGGGTATAAGSGNINDTVNLPSGASVTYTVSGTISPTTTGTLANTATVSSLVADPTPGNNSASDTDTLNPQADVSVTVTDAPDPVNAGSNVTYAITVNNAGLSTAGEITLANAIPTGTTFVSLASPGGWSATTPAVGSAGSISASTAGMAVGSAVFTLVVKVDYVGNGTVLSNTATVATDTDPASGNNSATATTTVVAIPEIALYNGASDLAPAITDGEASVIDYGNTTVGNAITRTFTVKNVGTGTLSLTSITIPTGFSLLAPFTPQNVAPAASFSFNVRYDADAIGIASGSVTIANNDTDEASFDFPISATRTNVPPVANAQTLSTNEDIALPIVLTGSDVDTVQTTLTYEITTAPANGTLSGTAANRTYTPNANYSGPDSFAFRVNDGTANSPVATVTLTIDAVNDVPVALAQTVSTNEDIALPITLAGTDVENSPLTYTITVPPVNGTLSGTGANRIYTPNPNFNGPDIFAFTVNDGTVDSPPAAVSITVNPVNDVPVALPQTVSTNEDIALPITLAGTDVENSTLAYTITTPPANGTLSGTGASRTYTPNTNYNGPDSFEFIANDGTVDSVPATVSIMVNPVNDPPTVVTNIPDVVQTAPGVNPAIVLPPCFSDVETASNNLTYTVSPPSSAFYTTSITAGVLTITSTQPGIADLTVTATDPDTGSVSDTFQLRVKHIPEIGGAGVPDTVISPAAPDQTIDLAGYFLDQDNDNLGYAVLSNSDPSKASYVLAGSMLTLHPLAPGNTTIALRVTDADGNTVDDSFVVTVEDPIPVVTPTPGFGAKINNQTGLFEVGVTTVNNNVFDIPGFRLRVTSALPAGVTLRNATSAAGSAQPYLDVVARLTPGQSLAIVLEFHSATRNFDGFNPTVVSEPLPGGITDVGTGAGQDIDVSLIRILPGSAGVLIEFTSQPGRFYQMEYSSDMVTWKKCLVPIQAGANRVQWIDRGPPYTDSHPGTAGTRFYRVSRID